jgi:nitrate/nitrite transporter NarK
LNWIPYYFEKGRHISGDRLALLASLPFWAVAASSMLLGVFADSLIRRGYDAGRVRQVVVCGGLLAACGLLFPAVLIRDPLLFQVFLIASLASMGGWSSNHWALTQRLAGVDAAGKWTGFQNCIGNFAGVLANWLSGTTYDSTHSFVPAFTLAAAAMVAAVIGYWFCIRRADPVNWSQCRIPQKKVAYTSFCD